MIALGLMNTASALDYDYENHPDGIRGYAKVIQVAKITEEGKPVVDSEGKPVMENALSFADGGRARDAKKIDGIISAYGGSYDFENHPDAIFNYASTTSVGVVDDEGNPVMDASGNQKMEPALKFSGGSKGWPAANLHNILAAYGLTFDFENYDSVGRYAKVTHTPKVDDKGAPVMGADGKQAMVPGLSFSGGAKLWNSSTLHAILTAYTH